MSIGGRIALTVILSLVMFGLVAAAVAGVVVVQALLLTAGAVCIVGTCALLVWDLTR